MTPNDTLVASLVLILVLGAVNVLLERRIKKLEQAIKWFAQHIRIDDRDLEKTPPPDDLAKLIEGFEDMD